MKNTVRTRVCGIVLNADKTEILLVEHKGLFPEVPRFFSLPGGGVDLGEDLKTAVKREVQEECGLTVRVGDLLFLYDFIREPIHSINHYFICEVESGTLSLGHDPEFSAEEQIILSTAFYPIADLENLRIPVYPRFLSEQLRQYITTGVVKTEYLGVFREII
jgi:8-oxo-dGTP diphosphatase